MQKKPAELNTVEAPVPKARDATSTSCPGSVCDEDDSSKENRDGDVSASNSEHTTPNSSKAKKGSVSLD